ncbi:MAG: HAD-IA family hydrolase [Akkermansiaceae bacterium]|jgi:phosphoglycolate phosphatase|tara:strand:+ start:3197 stop:3826 length:630 start_codon:yes stop_codon:yes gene_type:complete
MKYRTLVFDFDGTIADTLDESLKIYNQMAEQHDLRPIDDDEIHHLRHMKLNDFLDHLGTPRLLVPKLLFRGTQMLKSRIGSLPLIEGIAEVLPLLKKRAIHLGILTSNSVENAQLFLKTHGIDHLFSFVSSTSKLTGKAKHLRSIQRKYELNAGKMVYIGDELRDIKAAKKAGIPMAAVGWGFNSPKALADSKPDYLFQHPSELIKLLS